MIILSLINLALYLVLIFLVAKKWKVSKAHRRFLLVLIASFLWILLIVLETSSPFSDQTIFLFNRMDFSVAPLVAYFIVLFSLHFPNENKKLTLPKELLLFLPILFNMIVGFYPLIFRTIGRNTLEYNLGYYSIYASILLIYFILISGGVLLNKLINSHGRSALQLRYLFYSYIFSIAIALGTSLQSAFFGKAPDNLFLLQCNATIVFSLFTTIAIIKHRLMGIRLIIRKGLIYLITLVFSLIIYVGLIFLMQAILESSTDINAIVINLSSVLIIALGFEQLRRLVKQLIDNLFFPERKTLQQSLTRIKQELPQRIDLQKIFEITKQEIQKVVPVKSIDFALLDKAKGIYYSLPRQQGRELTTNSPLIKYLISQQDILVRDELPIRAESKSEVEKKELQAIGKQLDKQKIALIVPLGTEKPSGLLLCGPKAGKEGFTSDDIKYLNTLRQQASLALDNALLYQQAVERIKVK